MILFECKTAYSFVTMSVMGSLLICDLDPDIVNLDPDTGYDPFQGVQILDGKQPMATAMFVMGSLVSGSYTIYTLNPVLAPG